jgi:hypothetical protein
MNIKEARAIVGKMTHWTILSQGIELNERPGQITEDLPTLLKANRMVEKANERSKKRIDKIVAEKGSWKGKRSISMTIADRGIAALYVAASFEGDNPETADVLAMHNSNIVLCLDKRSIED